MDQDSINVGSLADNKYAKHLGVTLYSLLENCSCPEKIKLYIVDGNISNVNKKKLDKIAFKFKTKIHYLKPNLPLIGGLKINKQFGIATYYKFCLIESAPVKKLLYLDSDLVIEKDVKNLFNKNLRENIVYAAEDGHISTKNKTPIGLSDKDPYFNAGVLLINLEKWKKEKITEKAINFIKKNPAVIEFADQDGLNAVLRGKWKPLDPSWNALTKTFFAKYIPFKKNKNLSRFEILNLAKKKLVIHYAGILKPWYLIDPVPFKDKYSKYLLKTPWKNDKYEDYGILALKRILYYFNFVWRKLTNKKD